MSAQAFEGVVGDDMVAAYRRDGFVRIPSIISSAEAARFAEAALDTGKKTANYSEGSNIFRQYINAWQRDSTMRELTLHARLVAAAQKLAGVPLRLWHDQILIKAPHNEAPTEYHQDQPYWPHAHSAQPITAWIALVDVPVESGCMTFIPGSHLRTDLPVQYLNDPRSLFGICPDLEWYPRVTWPLRAGDCTFHHGRCAHMATSNYTDNPRVAHAVIFMDAATTYSGLPHPITDPLQLAKGDPLQGNDFPLATEFERWRQL